MTAAMDKQSKGKFSFPLLLDGATGTNLMRAGMPSGVCVEKWICDNPAPLMKLQRAYAEAGSMAVMAPSFGANRVKLAAYGLADKVSEINAKLVSISREAVGGGVLVAGDVAPTGIFAAPFGDASFEELVDIYREQINALRDAGADYIALETMMNLTDSRAALIAAKETGLPVTATLTVEDNGRTLSGGDIAASLTVLAAMGADCVGVNCSTGPEAVLAALQKTKESVALPLVAKPNAGLPSPDGTGSYSVDPDGLAAFVPEFIAAGAGVFGGCCGTTPAHICALSHALNKTEYVPRGSGALREEGCIIAADEYHIWRLDPGKLGDIPTVECSDELADDLMDLNDGDCAAIRIEVGKDGAGYFTDSAYTAKKPLVLTSDFPGELRRALGVYQGRAIIERRASDGAESEKLAAEFGAALL